MNQNAKIVTCIWAFGMTAAKIKNEKKKKRKKKKAPPSQNH
jgi:hypothetical protein